MLSVKDDLRKENDNEYQVNYILLFNLVVYSGNEDDG